jgi:S1-C subfamily serine protease
MSYDDEYGYGGGRTRTLAPLGVAAGCGLLAALALSALAFTSARGQSSDVNALQRRVSALQARLDTADRRSAAVAARLRTTDKRLNRKEAGVAPLAARVLKSVFMIETDGWLGAGFVAWTDSGGTYLITANHVIAHAPIGHRYVTVTRKGGSWSGQIVETDPKDDLALVRVAGRPAGAQALWQHPHAGKPPRPGDQLLLVGSPYGLEGTVTTGIVSRVTRKAIQTDAAANPGNSGGPAVDRDGNVVGVLVSGGGENLNFAVPIARACERLRHC